MPQSLRPDLAVEYDNLLYSCATCNAAKGDQSVPDPCACLLEGHAVVLEDGRIAGATEDAQRLILLLGLDDAEYRESRRLWIDIVAMAKVNVRRPGLYTQLMRYPESLPDLSRLRPPGNRRPNGVRQSYFARRQRGDLPETY